MGFVNQRDTRFGDREFLSRAEHPSTRVDRQGRGVVPGSHFNL